MKKFLIILIFPLILYSQTEKLTLADCIERGIKNSQELVISNSKIEYSKAKISEVMSLFFPQIKFAASYTYLSDVDPFIVNVPFSPVPIKISDVINNNYSFRFSFQQTLFNGFRLINTKQMSELNLKAYEKEQIKDINEVAWKIYNAYWNLYKTILIKNLLNENVSLLKKHLEDSRNFYNNGLIGKNDLLKVEVRLSNVKLSLLEAEQNNSIARLILGQLIGISLEDDSKIKFDSIKTIKNTDITSTLNETLDKRNEINALKYRIEAGRKAVNIATSGWFPNISIFGNYYYSNPNLRYQPPSAEFRKSWDIGINLSWDVWNWGYTSSLTEQANQQKIQSDAGLEIMKDMIAIEIKQAELNLNKSIQKLELSKLTREQAAENYRITAEKYSQHLVSSADLMDADVLLQQANTEYLSSLVDYEIATIRIKKVTGENIF